MKLEELLIQKNRYGAKYFSHIEAYILELLSFYLAEQHKPLSTEKTRIKFSENRSYYPDAIAPEGIDDLLGATLIEVKGFYRRDRIESLYFYLSQVLSRNKKFNSVLIIFAEQLADSDIESIKEDWSSIYTNKVLEVWDQRKLNQISKTNLEFSSKVSNNLSTATLNRAVSYRQSKTEWKEIRNEQLSRLGEAYKNNSMSLFLGAGVSIAAGMPDWTSLLDSLFVNLVAKQLDTGIDAREEEVDDLVKRLRDIDDPSPLMTARYLRRGIVDSTVGDIEPFLEEVTKTLYRLYDKRGAKSSLLLAALAQMCIPRRSGPKINTVVTYNFDDLFEIELDKYQVQHKSIYREVDRYSNDDLPVYHVHGFLPRDKNGYENLGEATFVFSEEGYHEVFLDPYHWSNLVQLSQLRDQTCLMAGLSLTDPNLRRLLEISARKSGFSKHYALMKRMSYEDFAFEKQEKVVTSRKTVVQKFLDSHHVMKEELFRELGLNIIWYEDYEELSELVNKIQAQDKP